MAYDVDDVEQLLGMNQKQLDDLFSSVPAGTIPNGEADGTAIIASGTRFSPVIAGLGPGSSAADHDAVGLPFTQRWARFDEGLRLVRALVRGEVPDEGRYYRVGGLRLDPLPSPPPEVWFGSWGSDLRIRRMAGASSIPASICERPMIRPSILPRRAS